MEAADEENVSYDNLMDDGELRDKLSSGAPFEYGFNFEKNNPNEWVNLIAVFRRNLMTSACWRVVVGYENAREEIINFHDCHTIIDTIQMHQFTDYVRDNPALVLNVERFDYADFHYENYVIRMEYDRNNMSYTLFGYK